MLCSTVQNLQPKEPRAFFSQDTERQHLEKKNGLCNPGSNHKVCSAHFPGGKTILAASTYQRSRRALVIHDNILQNSSLDDEVTEYSNLELCPSTLNEKSIEDVACDSDNIVDNLQKQIEALQSKNNSLQKKYDDMKAMEQCLFRMERFIGSDSDFRFYTGFPDYSTFKAFFNYLLPACNHLIYRGSTTHPINSNTQRKCGKQSSQTHY